jgi:hypothetical protein
MIIKFFFIHLLFSLIYRPATPEVISKEMRLKIQEINRELLKDEINFKIKELVTQMV